MSELKPCPWCGHRVRLTYTSFDNMYNFFHAEEDAPIMCYAAEPIQFDGYWCKSLNEAAKAWNRRADDEV